MSNSNLVQTLYLLSLHVIASRNHCRWRFSVREGSRAKELEGQPALSAMDPNNFFEQGKPRCISILS
jgi:hypothetical protein